MSDQQPEVPVRIIIVIKKRIATWVEGRHEAWVALIMLSVFAAVVELGYAFHGANVANVPYLRLASYTLSISLAALMSGIFLGFLFGIPRTLSGNQSETTPSANGSSTNAQSSTSGPSANGGTGLTPNTNLEQISDWLTKILVGVGLTQISKLSGVLTALALALKPGFGNIEGGGTLGVIIVIFFAICGFLIGYLWTRIYLTKEFVTAQAETVQRLTAQMNHIETTSQAVATALSTVQAQPDKDATALSLAQKLLDPTPGDQFIDQETLNDAVAQASQSLKVQLFYLGRKFRKDLKSDPDGRGKIARVIPIFRALIACDTEARYHRTHAQLSYSLSDKAEPQLEDAIDEIEKAIQIRESRKNTGYWNYEMFRAICHIRQVATVTDPQRQQQLKASIVEDLKVVCKDSIEHLSEEPLVVTWMQNENISISTLK